MRGATIAPARLTAKVAANKGLAGEGNLWSDDCPY
jgi:hypothetical protein